MTADVERDADAQREAIIRSFLPTVKRMARRLKRLLPTFELDDLIGDGSIGLIRAVDSFDPERGVSLNHYARCLILGAMLNGIRRMDPVPERTRRVVREGENLRYEVAAQLGAMPSRREMERLRPGYERAYVAAKRGQPLSIDWPLPENERIRVDWSSDPSAIHERRIEGARLRALVAELPARQRTVVLGRYWHEQSLRTLSRRMGVSPQRASQLHVAAMRRMREVIDAAQA